MPAKSEPSYAKKARTKMNGAKQQMFDSTLETIDTLISVPLIQQPYKEFKQAYGLINIIFENLETAADEKTRLRSDLKKSIAQRKKLEIEIIRLKKIFNGNLQRDSTTLSSSLVSLEEGKEANEDKENYFKEVNSLTNVGDFNSVLTIYKKGATTTADKVREQDPCKSSQPQEFAENKLMLNESTNVFESIDEENKNDSAFEKNGTDMIKENRVKNDNALMEKANLENLEPCEREFVKPVPPTNSNTRLTRSKKRTKGRLDNTVDLTDDTIISVTSKKRRITCKASVPSNILSVGCESTKISLTEKMKAHSYKAANPKEKTKKTIHGEISNKATTQLIDAINNEIEPDESPNLKLTPKKDLKSSKKKNNAQASLFNKSPDKYQCVDGPCSEKHNQSLTKNRELERSSSFTRSVSAKTGHGFSLIKRNAATKKIVDQGITRQPVLHRVLANDLRGKLAHLTTPERKAVQDHQRQLEDDEAQRLVSAKHDEAMRRKQQNIKARTTKLKDERKQREALVHERKRLVAEERANRLQSPARMAKCGLKTPARKLGDASARLNVINVATNQIQDCATFNINQDKAARKRKDDDHAAPVITAPMPTETFLPVIIDDSKSFSCEQKRPEIAATSDQIKKFDQESTVFQAAASSSSLYLSSGAPVPAIIDSTHPETESAQKQTVHSNRKSSRKRTALVPHKDEKTKDVQDQNSLSSSTVKRSKSKKMKSVSTADSYDMTPLRVIQPSTATNYNIDDLNSGDETDDDEAPRKEIPSWAKGNQLKIKLMKQRHLSDTKVIRVFGIPGKIDIVEIFGKHRLYKKRHRHLNRGETGDWEQPIFTSAELKQILGNDHDNATRKEPASCIGRRTRQSRMN